MRRLLRDRLRRKAIVTLKDGQSFAGVLFDADRETLILRNTEALDAGERGSAVPVDGEILLFRADVAFVQLP